MPNIATRLQPDVSGTAIPAGYIGQKITWTTPPSSAALTTSFADWTNANIVLTAGTWQLHAAISVYLETGTTATDGQTVSVRIVDSNDVLLGFNSKCCFIRTQVAAGNVGRSLLTFSDIVSLSGNQTYKIQGKKSATALAQLQYTTDDYSHFFAIRIA